MPIYEYRCENGHSREVIDLKREFMDVPSVICSQCGKVAMKMAANSNWNINHDPHKNESGVSRAIRRVRKAESQGRL